jgi:hypothetical protein
MGLTLGGTIKTHQLATWVLVQISGTYVHFAIIIGITTTQANGGRDPIC